MIMLRAARLTLPCAALAVLLAAGCTSLGDSPLEINAPPLTVTSHVPITGATGVPRDQVITIDFDGFPNPGTLVGQSVLLVSNAVSTPIDVRVDLVNQRLVCTATKVLEPDLDYTVVINKGLSTLGSPLKVLKSGVAFTFHTTATPPVPAMKADPPTFDQVYATFTTSRSDNMSCVSALCHAGPAGDLDLSSADVAAMALLGKRDPDTGLIEGQAASEAPMMLRVQAGRSETSLLLRKLVGSPDVNVTSYHVVGPSKADLELVRDWIDGGAHVTSCAALDQSYTALVGSVPCSGADCEIVRKSPRCNCTVRVPKLAPADDAKLSPLLGQFKGCPTSIDAACQAKILGAGEVGPTCP
jgi:hypothetical protein